MMRRLRRLTQLHPPVVLAVRASREATLRALATAARPSQQRLHLRNLFRDGRRYYLQPGADGFRLTSDARALYGPRRQRTPVAAYLDGTMTAAGDASSPITAVRLRASPRITYVLRAVLLPAFFSSIIVYMPWPPLLIALIMLALFAASLMGHLYTAALQAHEMLYFVQKALEDLPPLEVKELAASGPDVVMRGSEFREQWQRFYHEQTGE